MGEVEREQPLLDLAHRAVQTGEDPALLECARALVGDGVAGVLQEEAGVLGGVWGGVIENRSLDLDSVEGIVIALSKTVEENLGAMIPMASLKQPWGVANAELGRA